MHHNNAQKATSTEMFVNFLANTEKMVDTEHRWNYEGHDKNDDLDDNVENYVTRNPTNVFQKQEQKVEHGGTEFVHEHNESQKAETDGEPPLTREELLLLKLDTLRRLGELKECGVHLSQNYGMESDLKMMQYEVKLHSDIKSKQNAVQWMKHMMIGCLKGLEILNDAYNPFDIKLAGLTDKVSADVHTYQMVLGEIYEKYNQPGKQMAPEMKLLLMLSGAVLSLQASRILPAMMPRMATALKTNDAMLGELRAKAEASTLQAKNLKEAKDTPAETEHKEAAKRVSDLQMIKEKDLEYQRMRHIMETKPQNKNFRDTMILSSESQSRCEVPQQVPQQEPLKNQQINLQMMMQLAQQREQVKKEQFLAAENQKLDKIMENLNSDEQSVASSKSTKSIVSVNPNIKRIMKNKKKKENDSELLSKDISFGSSKDKLNKSDKLDATFGMISVGSKNKGEKMILNVGKK